ncbi:response regulator [Pelomonas sp. KK5]|uniref:response regulator n=1 Tax=Pelomonas sp. KK5 TaxID=1855730 RepID=UPI00097C9403|nr:response regulator [Pelomonas sp. KK5]
MTDTREARVIVFAPFGRDAQVIADVVAGMATAQAVHSQQQLLGALIEGAAAAVVTEEALSIEPGSAVHLWLQAQPSWSDFPFVALTGKRTSSRPPKAGASLHRLGNVILLERPVSAETLKTAVEAALRARARQYVTRQNLADLASAHAEVAQLNRDLEQRIEDRTRELSDANNRLMNEIAERERAQAALLQVQKMEAMGHLTGGIAHDFNNLLHVIGTNLDLLARLQSSPQVVRVVEVARRNVRRGARLTSQLLSFARSQSLVPQATDIHTLLEGMAELLATSVGSHVRINLELAHPHPFVNVDRNQLEMAILNLVVNARDAMPNGGSIVISTSEIPPGDASEAKRGLELAVADGGTGIPPSIIGRVFDPFFTTKPMGTGTGLGLAQVYGFAKQSGGEVRIESSHEAGTRVRLSFPVVDADIADEAEGETATADTARQDILVVEDDDEVRQSIVQSLEILGHQVASVADGEAALSAMRAHQPTLLIVDYVMPGMNGAELIGHVKASWPDLPIILATGYADMEKVGQVLGARSILKKPFRVETLAEAVHIAVA